jgi:peptidoglycan/LPS O-acetylase OafA/YrhL
MRSKERLPELDSLRGIAAISVVLFHYSAGKPPLQNIFTFGCTGVELFFLISGFVIFLIIQRSETAKSFLISRFARIYPAYWVCVTITAGVFIAWHLATRQPFTFPGFKDYAANLTMLQYYFNVKDIDDVYWTLIYELLFYLFILLIYIAGGLKKITLIGFAVIASCLLSLLIIKPLYLDVFKALLHYFPLLVYFPLFIAGITFYQVKFGQKNYTHYALLAACFVTQGLFFHDTNKVYYFSQAQYLLILAIYFGIFILYSKDLIKFIVNPVTLFLGKISYSLYLIHNLIGYSILIPVLVNFKYLRLNTWASIFLITLPVIIILATFINRYIEVPANRYIKRKLLANK